MPLPGAFIVFEGPDGVGKTTHAGLFTQWLRTLRVDVVMTREPGGTHLGKALRELILNYSIDNITELLLYSADRVEHIRQTIWPALNRGAVVVSDRWVDSTYAYQGYGRGIPIEWIDAITNITTVGLKPDIVFILWIPPEETIKRIKLRSVNSPPDRLESEGIDFYRRVSDAYMTLAKSTPERYVLLDGTAPLEAVQEQIRTETLKRKLIYKR